MLFRPVISVADSEEDIKKKMKKAFCPPEVENNPVLEILRYHVFPRTDVVSIRRPEKFGGDREFSTYEDLECAYAAGEVHPQDLKTATAAHLIDILAPVHDYVCSR